MRIVCDSGGRIRTEHNLSLEASSPYVVGVDKYALSCELACEMCLGIAEASRPVLRGSAANKRRCNSVTVAYLCSNPSKYPEKSRKTSKTQIPLFAGILQSLETSSKLSYCLHTAEAAGSNPASPTLKILRFAGKTWKAREGPDTLRAFVRQPCSNAESVAGVRSLLIRSTPGVVC
jgi:hypothetical protein